MTPWPPSAEIEMLISRLFSIVDANSVASVQSVSHDFVSLRNER